MDTFAIRKELPETAGGFTVDLSKTTRAAKVAADLKAQRGSAPTAEASSAPSQSQPAAADEPPPPTDDDKPPF